MGARLAQLIFDTRDQAFCHGGGSHHGAAANRLDGVAANGALRGLERDAGELGGARGEGVHGDADAGGDGAADVVAARVNHVHVGGGAKVHHNSGRAVEGLRRHGVGDAVGAHLCGVGGVYLGDHLRVRANLDHARAQLGGHGAPLARELRNHAGKADGAHARKREAAHLEVAQQADEDLVLGKGAVRGHAPRLEQLVLVKKAQGGLRVSHVDCEQHMCLQPVAKLCP